MILAEEFIGPDRWHGTTGGTTNHACKCLACRTVWTAHCLQARKDRAKLINPDDPRHGKYTFYANHGCRCEPCTTAHRIATYARLERKKASK